MASGESQRGARDAQTQERQHEGARRGEGQGHPRDLPDPPALHEGKPQPASRILLPVNV